MMEWLRLIKDRIFTIFRIAFCLAAAVVAGSSPLRAQPPTISQYNFSGGLNLSAPAHLIRDDQVADCHNVLFDDPPGAIRQRPGYVVYNTIPIASNASVRGLWSWITSSGDEQLVAVSSNVFAFSNGDGVFTTSLTSLIPTRDVHGAAGLGNFWLVGATNQLIKWDGTTATAIPQAPNGNLVATYKNRVWVANTSTEPARLFGSQFLDGTNWNIGGLPTDPVALTFGVNDNSPITALLPFTDAMLVFKQRSLYGLFGNDQQDFIIRLLSPDVGCLDQRSVASKGNLVVFHSLRGLEQFDGTALRLISNDVRPITDVTRVQASGIQSWTLDTVSDWQTGTALFTDTNSVAGVIKSPAQLEKQSFSQWTLSPTIEGDNDANIYVNAGNSTGSATTSWLRAVDSGTVQPKIVMEFTARKTPFDINPGAVTDSTLEFSLASEMADGTSGLRLNMTSTTVQLRGIVKSGVGIGTDRIYASSGAVPNDTNQHIWRAELSYPTNLTTPTVKVYRDAVFVASTTYTATQGDTAVSSVAFTNPTTLRLAIFPNSSGITGSWLAKQVQAVSLGTATWTTPEFVILSTPTAWNTFQASPAGPFTTFEIRASSSSSQLVATSFVVQNANQFVTIPINTHLQWRTSFLPAVLFVLLDGLTLTAQGNSSVDLVSWRWKRVIVPTIWPTETNRFWMAYTTSPATSGNSAVLVRDRDNVFTLFTNIFASRFATFGGELYHGDSRDTGMVFRDEVGTSDNGQSSVADVTTKAYAMGNPDAKKVFNRVYVDASAGPSGQLSLNVLPDLTTSTFSLGTWNSNEDFGVIHAKFPFPLSVPNRMRYAQFKMGNGGTSSRLDVNGFSVRTQELPVQ